MTTTHKIVVELTYERVSPALTAKEMAEDITCFLSSESGLHNDDWFPGVTVVRTIVVE